MINFFLNTKLFDKLNKFISRKIFKIFKIFFVETKLQKLPENSYPIEIDGSFYQINFNKLDNSTKPYTSYSHLIDLISIIEERKKDLTFFDYGANNLSLFFYLSNKFKNINYFFEDQIKIKNEIEKSVISKNLVNLKFATNDVPKNIDLAYFGSSIQYLENYYLILEKFFKKSRYILIAQSPFFENDLLKDKIVLKQVNMHPFINYLYLMNLDNLINFMKKNNYFLVEKNRNKVTKFMNFKNFHKKYKNLDMYDLLFKYSDEK